VAKKDRLIIIGGGLAGCLAALALDELRPDQDFLLIEGTQSFGGDHIWSFFDADVGMDERRLIEPLIVARWSDHDVRFPNRYRTLPTPYNSIASTRLDTHVRSKLAPPRYRLGASVTRVATDHVELKDGELIQGTVVDARGPGAMPGLHLGWQKFVGQSWKLARPHGLTRPIIMDATVDQREGYRFVYCLPFSSDRILIEDTYYSLDPALDREALRARIQSYAREKGWELAERENEEEGLLPIALGGSIQEYWNCAPGLPRIGLAGGFFHPTTGYSLPDAARIALLIARQENFSSGALHTLLLSEAGRLWRERRFYRLLNRMLLHAAAPAARYRILEHFYRLDAEVVARFYAGRSDGWDKLRILSGKPPVPVRRAIRALAG
jgi:lycopene beta-cyclase